MSVLVFWRNQLERAQKSVGLFGSRRLFGAEDHDLIEPLLDQEDAGPKEPLAAGHLDLNLPTEIFPQLDVLFTGQLSLEVGYGTIARGVKQLVDRHLLDLCREIA